ncbi:MAG: fibronectin type III domain-containing protein, partial [archaeon]
TSPTAPTYTKAGQTVSIAFTWSDSNIHSDANAKLYYSSSQYAFTSAIADINLMNSNYCTIATGVCAYTWTVPSASDGNYFIDLNVHDWNSGVAALMDLNYAASSQSFVIDGTVPTITVRQPSDLNTQVTSRAVQFDVNDVIGVNLSGIRADVNKGAATFQSAWFSNASSGGNCVLFGSGYYCSYTEYGFDTNGTDYNITISASDLRGNSAVPAVSKIRFLDANAPPAVTGLAVVSGGNGTSADLSWSNSTDYNSSKDINNFNIYFDLNNAITSVAGRDRNYYAAAGASSYTATGLLRDKNYYFAVVAVDKSGNLNGTITPNQNGKAVITADTNAPTLAAFKINGGSTYSSSALVRLDLNVSSDVNSMNFSCSSTSFVGSRERGYGTRVDDFNITDSNISCPANDANINVYARIYDQNGNYAQAAASIILDRSAASIPEITGVSQTSDGKIRVAWGASTDALSGITKYKVYKSDKASQTLSNMSLVFTTDNNYTRDYNDYGSLVNNTTYYYAATSTNGALIESNSSTQVSLKYFSGCSISPKISVPANVKAGKYTITASADGAMYNVQLKARKPGQTDYNILSGTSGVPSVSADFYVNAGEDGTVLIILNAMDSMNRVCDTGSQMNIDTINPSVVWYDPVDGNVLNDVTRLKASAIDSGNFPSGIASVKFYYNDSLIADVNASGTNMVQADWNVFTVDDGNYVLKAVATDKAGNSSDKNVSVSVRKEAEGLSNATKALSNARISRASAIDLQNYLSANGITISTETAGLKKAADANYAQAQNDFGAKNYPKATVLALDAAKNYDSAVQKMNSVKISTESAANYFYDTNTLKTAFADYYPKAVAEEARGIAEIGNVQRKLEIVKVMNADTNRTYYRANVSISFKNPGARQALRVRETIPKEFAKSAGELSSDFSFAVIQNDPVIEWVIDLNAGQKAEIHYGLKKEMTKEEADALAKAGIMQKYSAPPMVVKAITGINGSGNRTAGKGIGFYTLIGIAAVIIIGIAAYFVYLRPKRYTFHHSGNAREQAKFAAKETAEEIKKKLKMGPKLRP